MRNFEVQKENKRVPMLEQVIHFVKQELAHEGSGHDWWHAYRVWKLSEQLQHAEGGNKTIISVAALTHDIADPKLNDGNQEKGLNRLSTFLKGLPLNQDDREHLLQIAATLSYKGAGVVTPMATREGEIVQDADRLDAIGAIGIARTFAFGGHHNRLIYDPNHSPESHTSYETYKNSTGHTINHFYEKLLLLKDRMNTDTAKAMARERHHFMEQFLNEFYAEWEGKK